MNNKKNLAPDTGADGDNTINTKKGFLLSFPARNKKAPEPGSAIVDAKTIGGNSAPKNGGKPHPENKDGAPNQGERREKKQQMPKKEGGANEARDGERRQQPRKEGANEARDGERRQQPRPEQQNGANTGAPRHGRHGGRRDGQPSNENAPQNGANASEKNNQQKKQDAQNGRQNGQNRPSAPNQQNQQNQKNAAADGEKQPKNNQNNQNRRKGDNRDNRDNRRGDRGEGNREGGNNNNRRGGKKGGRRDEGRSVLADLPGLSLLSKDMRAPGGHLATDDQPLPVKGKKEKELTLEEKYKDAIPLADQIAAEEAKRMHKPRACVIEKIDRDKTANERQFPQKETVKAESAEASSEEAVSGNAEMSENTAAEAPQHYEIVGIRFREAGKIYYFDPDGNDIAYGTPVIVETARGSEYGFCAIANRLVPVDSVVPPLKKIKRLATTADTEKHLANQQLAAGVGDVFNKKVAELGLPMNLVYAEYTFDNSKLLFYFTAETRIDFRQLVKELASVFRTRIELRQIGVRDEAKQLGGVGVCGQRLCCHAFLSDFAQVSIKMAKDQGLSLGSAKISGSCGKLMCCLRYEDKVYEEEASRTPRVGCIVETPEGKGTVTESNALSGKIKVALESAPEAPAKAYTRDDVKIIGFKRQQRDEEPESEELKELEDKEN